MSESAAKILICAVESHAGFEMCVDLQVAVWGYSGGDIVPRRMFVLAQRIGGQVIGAFDGGRLVGFAMALPGYRKGCAYLHSHMVAVVSEYRNQGLGRRLKMAQYDDAMARGFELMEWTFDPLEIKNAYLNIAKLGVICRRYEADFYGPSTSPLQGGLPTDRLYAEWWLRSPRVGRHLGGGEVGERGGAERILERISVPRAVEEWKRDASKRELAKALQEKNKDALESAFRRGLVVVGYERESNGDGCFLLGPCDPCEGVPASSEGWF